jgi:hypothetical protein
MGFNSGFKGLMLQQVVHIITTVSEGTGSSDYAKQVEYVNASKTRNVNLKGKNASCGSEAILRGPDCWV